MNKPVESIRDMFAYLTDIVLIIGFANIVAFSYGALILGGVAFVGGIDMSGEYYVRMGASDPPITVSKNAYMYSIWHGRFVVLGVIVALVIGALNEWVWAGVKRRPKWILPLRTPIMIVLRSLMFIAIFWFMVLAIIPAV